jgi:alkanesulfonate monooxygenase SsuD/methylene tetrahydromethanopterin reductase-like flavin-dependent oxidoreductase (luciferase family)
VTDYGYLLPTRGAVLDAESPEDLSARLASDVVGLAAEAESLGLSSVWVGDSVLAKPRPEPMVTLAAVATATEDVTLGTAVYLPTLRHPVNVAHQATTLDLLSGGRVALGMGVGRGPAVEREYGNLDRPYDRRGRLLDETLDVVTALTAGETVTYDGEYVSLEDATLGLESRSGVPQYVPYRTVDEDGAFPAHVEARIADHADGWLPIAVTPETYRAGLASIRDLLAEAGRDPDAFDPAFYVNVVVDETEAAAIETAREFLESYYPRLDGLSDDEVREQGAFGPPAVVADRLDDYREAGVDHFVVRFTGGDQADQLRRFGDGIV